MANPKSQPEPLARNISQTPGAVISPSGAVQQSTPPSPPAAVPPALTATPSEAGPRPEVAESSPDTLATQPAAAQASGQDDQTVSWTASEFVAHDKSAGWYFMLAAGSVSLAALIFFLTRDVISASVVIVASCILGIYGSHKPRQLEYEINRRGLGIGPKRYPYENFKSFAIIPEGALSSLVFMPLKRFAVPITVYYAPEDEDKILSVLSDQLPLEEHRLDAMDSLLRRIRF